MSVQSIQKKPLISVCIPVFNGEKYIRECIASVLAQSEGDFELLISDNCSTDRTLEICNEFKDPRIRILKNSYNIGSINNFNQCIQEAVGELFVMLPCDDLLEEDCFKLLCRGFIDNPSVGIAFGSIFKIDDEGRKIQANISVHRDGVLDNKEAIRLIAEKFNPIQHPMVRTKVFADIGGLDPRGVGFCDIYLWSKILFRGWDAYVVHKPITSLRCHEKQGQTLFRKNTKGNLKELSDHFGYSLPKDFYKKNHANLQFFEFIQFFSNGSNEILGSQNDVERIMLIKLTKSHLSNLCFSLSHCNISGCWVEITLSAKLIRVYGAVRILNIYISTVISKVISVLRKTFTNRLCDMEKT